MNAVAHSVEHEYDTIVRADIETFRRHAEDFVAGRITDDQFRAQRLRRGVYGQRQAGVHMVRTKVPGGRLSAEQMEQLALVADRFSIGRAHVTTRQNVQFHFVPLENVPAALHALADARLTTREACYNTVRNVTACPTAGLLRDEVFDVNPYALRTAFAFLHNQLTDAMPRKFKIAFCGCAKDCMLTAIHDVGLRALIRNENGVQRRGFRMVIGGGLGPLPVEAIILDEFIPEERLTNRIEAMLRVFTKYGNYNNKNKARFKFIVRERGAEWVRDAIEREYADILANGGIATPEVVPENFGASTDSPRPLGTGVQLPVLEPKPPADPRFDAWLETNVQEQRQPGYAVATIVVPQGNLTSDQMRSLARLAREAGDGTLRVTIDQNLKLAFIPVANLRRVYIALREIGLADAGANEISDVTTCPGSWTCNLGLTKTMNLGDVLVETVRGYDDPHVRRLQIKASGCPNSCGQHWIADIGFYGNSRKIEGREVPYYQMLLGGGHDASGVIRFGLAISSIPARTAPIAVRRVLDHFIAERAEGESFRDYVVRHKVEHFKALVADLVKPTELTPELFRDWGDEEAFSLKLGRGECAS
jgi:sulfite reductase beta subunit-like hemoprotein